MSIRYSIDGNQVCATKHNFIDLQTSPAGFGDSLKQAFEDLMVRLERRNELPRLSDVKSWERDWLEGYLGLPADTRMKR